MENVAHKNTIYHGVNMKDIQGRFKSLLVYNDEVIVYLKDLELLLERISSVYPLLDENVHKAIDNLKGSIISFEEAWENEV